MEFADAARLYNQREALFGHEITNYDKIANMQREFIPYSNLWITANNWYKNKDIWMEVEWERLDAVYAERFVEDSIKLLIGVIRFLRERGIETVLKIA